MSTRPDEELVNLLSQWLARHVDDDELCEGLVAADAEGLSKRQRHAIGELQAELDGGNDRGELEMVARETLEALALG
jgi:hypothetical protein